MTRLHRPLLAFAILTVVATLLLAEPPSTDQPQGLRDKTPDDVALVGARIVVRPGEVIDQGVIVIRDGVITDVYEGDEPPADATARDVAGHTIYAGFIDSFGEVDAGSAVGSAPYWNSEITPQREVAAAYEADSQTNESLRKQGFAARLAAPNNGILKGVSALVATGDDTNEQAILKRRVAQHLRLTVSRGRGRDEYPGSPMGAVALARQAMHDAQWLAAAKKARASHPTLPSPGSNDALEALESYPRSDRLIIADAINELYFLRADLFAREFDLNVALRGSGYEYRRLDAVKATGRSVILPINFPQPPNVGSVEAARNVSTTDLMDWDLAPENPARLAEAGVPFVLTTHLLDKKSDFLKNLRKAVHRGLDKDTALAALTTRPAKMFQVEQELGAVAKGMRANLVVTDGDLFEKDTKVVETWVLGKRYGDEKREAVVDVIGTWKVQFERNGKRQQRDLEISGKPEKLEGSWQALKKDGESQKLLRISLADSRLAAAFEGKALDEEGIVRLSAVAVKGEGSQTTLRGRLQWADGDSSEFTAQATKSDAKDRDGDDAAKNDTKQGGKDAEAKDEEADAKASVTVNYPLGAFGVSSQPKQPKHVLFHNATVWTCGRAGVLKNATVLVRDGKIVAVGKKIRTPDDAVVIDASGKHLTPGIIDCHSHMATDGGVNEGTQAITCEVRIGDFIDSDDVNIYRQLAGGVTSANILHGSANPIGGQNQVIKLRWGALPEAMKFAEAPAGVKFALGENVKQSNWGDEYRSRYPQTRMGVEQIMRDAFQAAVEYRKAQQDWEQDKTKTLPPRTDMELEALAEMVEGKRWIHCHSYRQDEILALMRTLEDFGIRIGSFQHILEGYKVAPEMARHGATGSAFSDWWAYKFEVFDAIPYNGALMHEAGVVVSFNSDDRELARHLNHEAAKAVKYGGVSPEEALKFVTLNPAKQLRVDQYVGSIERGKHADLVLWSGPPLSILSRCEQTWIDGCKYFDRDADLAQRGEDRKLRAKLIQKILASGETMLLPGEKSNREQTLWPRDDIYCHHHDHDHDEWRHLMGKEQDHQHDHKHHEHH